jgi:hypothetical protein
VALATSKGGRGTPFIAGYEKLVVGVPHEWTSLTQGQTSPEKIQISTVGTRPGLVRLKDRQVQLE